jgi:hypothetical protein
VGSEFEFDQAGIGLVFEVDDDATIAADVSKQSMSNLLERTKFKHHGIEQLFFDQIEQLGL